MFHKKRADDEKGNDNDFDTCLSCAPGKRTPAGMDFRRPHRRPTPYPGQYSHRGARTCAGSDGVQRAALEPSIAVLNFQKLSTPDTAMPRLPALPGDSRLKSSKPVGDAVMGAQTAPVAGHNASPGDDGATEILIV